MKLLSEKEICAVLECRLQGYPIRSELNMHGMFEKHHANMLINAVLDKNLIRWADDTLVNINQLNNIKRNDIVIELPDTWVILEVKTKDYLFAGAGKKITQLNVHKQILGYALRQSVYEEQTKKLQLLVVMPNNYKIKCTKKLHNLGIDVSDHKAAMADLIYKVCADVAHRIEGSGVQLQSRLIHYLTKDDINLSEANSQIINY